MGDDGRAGRLDWRIRLDGEVVDRVAAHVSERRTRSHLLVGAAGAGKSTLLAAIGDRLAERGHARIPIAGAEPLRELPLAAFAPLVADLAGDGSTESRLQRIYDVLVPSRADHVLLIDDAHLIDRASGAVIVRLVRSYGVRTVLSAPSPQALGDEIARLAEDGIVAVTEVPRLDRASAAMAVETALGGRVDPDELRSLLDRAGGNPLHLRELVASAVREAAVVPGPHGLRLVSRALPARLRRSIARRYAELDPDVRRLAELIAAAGALPRPADPTEVDALDALEADGLVQRRAGGVAVLAEPLHGEVLLAQLDEGARDARVLEAAGRLMASDDPVDRFRGIAAAGRSSRPPSVADLSWAAGQALLRQERESAIELVDRAAGLAAARGEALPEEAALTRAEALSATGRVDEAEAAFAGLLASVRDEALLARAASRLGFHHAVRRMDTAGGARIAADQLPRLSDPAAIEFLEANVAKLRFWSGGGVADPEWATQDGLQRLNVELLRLSRSVFTGDLATARVAIERARPLADAHGQELPHAAAAVDFGEFLVLVDEARGADALAHVLDVRARRDDESKGLWAYAVALLAWLRGEPEAALAAAGDAAEFLAWRDSIAALGPARALRATAAARLGRHEEARGLLASIGEEHQRANVPTDLQAAEAEAWLLAADGELDGAEAAVDRAVRRGLDAQHPTFAALAAHAIVRLGRPAGVLEPLREATVAAPGAPLIALVLEHAEALAARDPAALLPAALRLGEAGLRGAAIDAVAQAQELARAQRATPLARRAALLAAQLRGADAARPVELTAREFAVADAAAARLRNREIADRLGLSVRTVENHLASVYRKLGVAGRDELGAALR